MVARSRAILRAVTHPNSLGTNELRSFPSGHFLDRRTLLLALQRRSVRRNRVRPNADCLRNAFLNVYITVQPLPGLGAVEFLHQATRPPNLNGFDPICFTDSKSAPAASLRPQTQNPLRPVATLSFPRSSNESEHQSHRGWSPNPVQLPAPFLPI